MSLKFKIVEGSIKAKRSGTDSRLPSLEAVHHPAERPWIGEKINLGQHFDRYSVSVLSTYVPGFVKPDLKVTNKKVKEMMEMSEKGVIDDDMFAEIMENCDIENFSTPREMEPQQQFIEVDAKYAKFVPSAIPSIGVQKLNTLRMQQEFIEKASEYDKFKRMRSLRNPNNAHFEAAPPPPRKVNTDFLEKEIVVSIRVYRPVKTTTKNMASAMTTVHRFVQEIYMLGRNVLSQLRDLIKCHGDYMVQGEVSESAIQTKTNQLHPTSAKETKKTALERYKSAFFFIEDCFYNDMRWADCHDLSQVVREWASDAKRQIGPFITAKMEDVKIRDLTLRLGYPYVYVHQGDHEHLICFVDARLLSADDSQKPSSYPFERSNGMIHSKMCMACNTYVAKWITTNNDRVPEDPFFLQ